MLWAIFLGFPLPWIAILTGWFTAEVGRQPWMVYGVLRTADALTPFLTAREATISLVVFCVVYSFIFAFGIYYIYRLLRAGPAGRLVEPPVAAVPNRPMSVVDEHPRATIHRASGRMSHDHVLGGGARHQHSPLCAARRVRSRRRHPLRHDRATRSGAPRC